MNSLAESGDLRRLEAEIMRALASARDLTALEQARVAALGRKGSLTGLSMRTNQIDSPGASLEVSAGLAARRRAVKPSRRLSALQRGLLAVKAGSETRRDGALPSAGTTQTSL